MIGRGIKVKGSKVLVLGTAFKPNVRDLRNTKVRDIVTGLKDHGCWVEICEPLVDEDEIFGCKNVSQKGLDDKSYDYIVLAVKHETLKGLWKRADYSI